MPFIPPERVHDDAHDLRNAAYRLEHIADHALRGGPLDKGDRKRLREIVGEIDLLANKMAGAVDPDGVLDEEAEMKRLADADGYWKE